MIRFSAVFFMLVLAASLSTASGATYSWTDEQGTVHFTEDPGKVPEKIRKKVLRGEENETVPEETPSETPAAKAPEATLQAAPAGSNGDDGLYGGKTYGQWQKELAESEAALVALRQRIDEVAAQFRNPAAKKEERDKLLAEHKSLSTQFSEMKARYFQLVENARKAGLTVDIQQ